MLSGFLIFLLLIWVYRLSTRIRDLEQAHEGLASKIVRLGRQVVSGGRLGREEIPGDEKTPVEATAASSAAEEAYPETPPETPKRKVIVSPHSKLVSCPRIRRVPVPSGFSRSSPNRPPRVPIMRASVQSKDMLSESKSPSKPRLPTPKRVNAFPLTKRSSGSVIASPVTKI